MLCRFWRREEGDEWAAERPCWSQGTCCHAQDNYKKRRASCFKLDFMCRDSLAFMMISHIHSCMLQLKQMLRAACVPHLGKPKEVMSDGGRAALDLHKWDLIFSCDQDVLLVVEYSCQVYTPDEINERYRKPSHQRRIWCNRRIFQLSKQPSRKGNALKYQYHSKVSPHSKLLRWCLVYLRVELWLLVARKSIQYSTVISAIILFKRSLLEATAALITWKHKGLDFLFVVYTVIIKSKLLHFSW